MYAKTLLTIRTYWRVITLFVFGLFLRLAIFNFDFATDVHNHLVWSKDLLERGATDFYALKSSETYASIYPNYAPLVILMFGLCKAMFIPLYELIMFININIPAFPSSTMSFFESKFFLIFLLKLPAILADLGIAFVFCKYFKGKISQNKNLLILTSLVFSPALILTRALWGQTDSILILMILLVLVFLLKDKLFLGLIFLFLAFFFKPNMILYLPIIMLFLYHKFDWIRVTSYGLTLMALSLGLISWAFAGRIHILAGADIYLQNSLLSRDLSQVSNSAYNFWVFLLGFSASKSSTLSFLLSQSFEFWGICIWLSILALAFLHWKKSQFSLELLLQVLFISSFGGFLFLSKMHERYVLYPLVILIILSGQNWKYFLLSIFLQVFAFVNIYFSWSTPFIPLLEFKSMLTSEMGVRLMSLGGLLIFFWFWALIKQKNIPHH